jgi:hypothetical protein
MLAYADVQGPNFVDEDNMPEKQSPILAAKPAAWYLSRSIFYNLRA